MHPEIDTNYDSEERDGPDTGSIPVLDDYSLVNLTKLSWTQPLVASIRLYLALGALHTVLPVHVGDDKVDGALYTDDDLKTLIDSALLPDDKDLVDTAVYLKRSEDEQLSFPVSSIIPAQRALADRLDMVIGDRGRSGAILAVLLTELGWPVKKISKSLTVSRPTLNKWVMIHANDALTEGEFEALAEILETPDSSVQGEDLVYALVDVRTEPLRTKRSGLTWQKAAFLPSEEIADIVRALWAVSVRVRGEKSSTDDLRCSYALDMFIDILLRRGVTAQNIGRIVGVTHAAVLHRWTRSRLWREGDEYGKLFWMPQDYIALAPEGFSTSEEDASGLTPDMEWFRDATVTSRRRPEDHTEDILLSVHTHEASDVNEKPMPNVYMLCTTTAVGVEPETTPIETAQFARELYTLDDAPTGDAVKTMRNLVAKHSAKVRFEPLRVSTSLLGTNFALNDLITYLHFGGDRVDTVAMSPLTDQVVLPNLFDVDRYGFPSIRNHRQWTDGVVLSEVLLVQAVGQYNRDADEQKAMGRPGFGDISHHWVPAEVLGAMIDLYTHDQARDRIAYLQSTTREFSETHLRHAVGRFLPDAANAVLERWTRESDFPRDDQPTLLWECLTTPHKIVARYDRPKRRSA